MSEELVKQYVAEIGTADSFKYVKKYHDNMIYEIWRAADAGACTGYPQYILVNGDRIRAAEITETIEIMRSLRKNDD